jgi:membrane glycosyltransferase
MTAVPPTADSVTASDLWRGVARVPQGWRDFIFYSSALFLTGLTSWLFADLLGRTGWSLSALVLLCLFTALCLLIAVGCMNGVFGFVLRLASRGSAHHPTEGLPRPKHSKRQHRAGLSHLQRARLTRLRGVAGDLPVPAKNRPTGPVRFLNSE